jgi:hypothetical protein
MRAKGYALLLLMFSSAAGAQNAANELPVVMVEVAEASITRVAPRRWVPGSVVATMRGLRPVLPDVWISSPKSALAFAPASVWRSWKTRRCACASRIQKLRSHASMLSERCRSDSCNESSSSPTTRSHKLSSMKFARSSRCSRRSWSRRRFVTVRPCMIWSKPNCVRRSQVS